MFGNVQRVPIFATAKHNKLRSGRYSSGQRGQTVNLLCELRRFESCSPHGKAEKSKNCKFSIFSKSPKKCLKASKSHDLLAFLLYGLFSIFINAHKIKSAQSMHLDLTRTYNTALKQFEGSSSKHYYTKNSITIINLKFVAKSWRMEF